jgi:hypothetical protein
MNLLDFCIERLDYANGYSDYITSLNSNITDISEIGIFGNDVKKQAVKAKNEFYGLDDISISAEPDISVNLLFSDRITDVLVIVMSVVCAVLFVLSAVFFGIRTKRGTDDSKKILTRWNVLGAGAVSLFCSVIFFLNPAVACAYAVAMVICACVLYFVYYIYPRVFFTLASVCVAQGFLIHAGFGLSTARAFSSFLQLMSKIGTLVLPIAAIVWFLLAAKKHPKLTRGIALWQPVAVCAVALIGALLLWCGSLGIFYFAYHYVLYAIAAALAAVGIIYTVKSI